MVESCQRFSYLTMSLVHQCQLRHQLEPHLPDSLCKLHLHNDCLIWTDRFSGARNCPSHVPRPPAISLISIHWGVGTNRVPPKVTNLATRMTCSSAPSSPSATAPILLPSSRVADRHVRTTTSSRDPSHLHGSDYGVCQVASAGGLTSMSVCSCNRASAGGLTSINRWCNFCLYRRFLLQFASDLKATWRASSEVLGFDCRTHIRKLSSKPSIKYFRTNLSL